MRFEPCYVLIINLHYLCYGSEVIYFECVCVCVDELKDTLGMW